MFLRYICVELISACIDYMARKKKIFVKLTDLIPTGTKTGAWDHSCCQTDADHSSVKSWSVSKVRLMIYLQEVITEDFCFLRSVGEKRQQRRQISTDKQR